MAEFFVASINEKDYDAFWRILHDHLPNSFDKWLYLRSQKVAKLESSGHVVTDVEIYPSDFLSVCDSDKSYENLDGLWRFACEKAFGERK